MDKEQEQRPAACPFCAAALIKDGEIVRFWKHPIRSLAEAKCPGTYVSIEFHPDLDSERLAAWNRRASDAQAEVVGWIDRLLQKAMQGPSVAALSGTIYSDKVDDNHVALYAHPSPAVAGGVTEALRSAMGMCEQYADFIRRVPAADIEQHPYLPELEQVIEIARAALSVGDEEGRDA